MKEKNKKRALIVMPFDAKAVSNAVACARLLSSFEDWEVKYLSPTDRHIHPASVVIIPDTGGLYPFASYFEAKSGCVAPQDNAVEEFRLKTLHYYVQKGTGIFGLGASAYLTFAEVCGGKVTVVPGSGLLAYTGDIHKKAHFDGETFFSQKQGTLCAGMGEYNLNEDLVAFIEEVFFCPPPEPVGVFELVNRNPSSPGDKKIISL